MNSNVAPVQVTHRRRRPRRRTAVAQLRTQTVPSTPAEVLFTLRLGFVTSMVLPSGSPAVRSVRVNDPISVVPNWLTRAQDFAAYRVVAIQVQLTPSESGASQTNAANTYASVLYSAPTVPSSPPGAPTNLLELAGSKLRPLTVSNPRSAVTHRWRAQDLNNLVYGNIGSPPPASAVLIYFGILATTTAPTTMEVSGWMQVEFRGLAMF